ncbi:hypothetical protein VTJ04DRAFT_6579 [Mycothermus thermophilus]|uniref:uncharacterized protein n=1 Tax=Humicola insolens TaxID=85995 RepID=UPI003741F7A1
MTPTRRRPSIFRTPSVKPCPPTPKGTRAMSFSNGGGLPPTGLGPNDSTPELPPVPCLLKPATYVPPTLATSRPAPARPPVPSREPSAYDSEPYSTSKPDSPSLRRRTRPKTPVREIGELEKRSYSSRPRPYTHSRSNSSRSERASSVDLIADQYNALLESQLAMESEESLDDDETEEEPGHLLSAPPSVKEDSSRIDFYLNRPLPPTPPPSLRSRRGHGPDNLHSLQDSLHHLRPQHYRSQSSQHIRDQPPPLPTSHPRYSAASVASTYSQSLTPQQPTFLKPPPGSHHSQQQQPVSAPTTAASESTSTLASLQDDTFFFKPISFGPEPVLQESPPPSSMRQQFSPLPGGRSRAATVGSRPPGNVTPVTMQTPTSAQPLAAPKLPLTVTAAAASASSPLVAPLTAVPELKGSDGEGKGEYLLPPRQYDPTQNNSTSRRENNDDSITRPEPEPERDSDADSDEDDTPQNLSLQITLDLLTRELSLAMRRNQCRAQQQQQRQQHHQQYQHQHQHQTPLCPPPRHHNHFYNHNLNPNHPHPGPTLGHRRGLPPSSTSTTSTSSSLSFSSAPSRPASPSPVSATSYTSYTSGSSTFHPPHTTGTAVPESGSGKESEPATGTGTGTSALQVWLMIEAYERVREEMARMLRDNLYEARDGSRGEKERVKEAEGMVECWLRALYGVHEEMVGEEERVRLEKEKLEMEKQGQGQGQRLGRGEGLVPPPLLPPQAVGLGGGMGLGMDVGGGLEEGNFF